MEEERWSEDGSLLSEIIFLGTGCASFLWVGVRERMCERECVCARAHVFYGLVTCTVMNTPTHTQLVVGNATHYVSYGSKVNVRLLQ